MSKVKVLEIQNRLLQEELDTLRGLRKPYRAIEVATGEVRDFDTAEGLMDHLFALGGIAAFSRFYVYKNHRRVLTRTRGGEVGALARRLERL